MEFLTFNLGKIEYAIELSNIREIMSYPENITKLPNSSKQMKGLINLRGEVVPIIDLRIKFNIHNEVIYDANTAVIAIKTKDNRMLGLVTDNVIDTKDLDISVQTELREIGTSIPSDFLDGIIKYENNMIAMVNVEAIVCKEQI